jgi:gliding motility-associated protein GldL
MALIDTNSKGWKNFMAKLYGLGAAVVIIGALFKIQHWKGADIMLIIGLGTEAVIFAFSAFEKPHEEIDWSLVYPELAHIDDDEEGAETQHYNSRAQELNSLMEKAQIDQQLIEGLGEGLQKFGEAATKLNQTVDAAFATQQYGEQIQLASKKLEAMNDLFETQLKNRSMQDDASRQLMENMASSVESAEKLSGEIRDLAANMGQLNGVYGNMLSAMSVTKK